MNSPVFASRYRNTFEAPDMSSGKRAGKVADVEKLQRLFPEIVAKWLKDHFNGNKELIAVVFDTDEKTARNWLSGLNCPSGPRAAAMILQFPDLRGRLHKALSEAA